MIADSHRYLVFEDKTRFGSINGIAPCGTDSSPLNRQLNDGSKLYHIVSIRRFYRKYRFVRIRNIGFRHRHRIALCNTYDSRSDHILDTVGKFHINFDTI
ncbi:hypothetical protein [Porphyromonas gingivalis]|uniref:hypothetical protein n=1 Tax=Porphyromonas gingivalis TaxID=837 RepID=UPI001C52D63C|nr:hypothetical protein [Porphyromonas gingivalis]